ncbi:MAG: nucleotidyltransferase domain-containing protein [Minicystis sp.]
MDLRIHELGAIDPLAVPLPNGTEVTTRVDRVIEADRRVPQGAVGRVVAQRDGELDVMVVGVGVIRYARSELVPRKIGQIRYARRRAGAWEALRPCTVLEATVGSRAWGLADEGSDHDQRGIFVLPFPWTIGLGDAPRDLVSTDGSATYWEADKAIRQALRADPNTLELLFVRSARALESDGRVDPGGARCLRVGGDLR